MPTPIASPQLAQRPANLVAIGILVTNLRHNLYASNGASRFIFFFSPYRFNRNNCPKGTLPAPRFTTPSTYLVVYDRIPKTLLPYPFGVGTTFQGVPELLGH